MYSTLSSKCPYNGPNNHLKFCTLRELQSGFNTMMTSSTRFDIPDPKPQTSTQPPPVPKNIMVGSGNNIDNIC